MGSRKESSRTLEKTLNSIGHELKNSFTSAEKAIQDFEVPDSMDQVPSLLSKYKNLVRLVIDHRESYNTVYRDFQDSVEATARRADKTDEEIDDLLSAAADPHLPLLAKALTLKSQLNGCVADLEGTRQRLAQDEFQKQQEVETDRRRRAADEAERKREEAELREKNLDIEFKNREREKRLEWEEQQKMSLITLEETERKAKIANDERLLTIQENQLADQSKLEREKLQLVQDAGMSPEALATLFSNSSASGGARGQARSSAVNRPKLILKEFHGDPLAYNEFIQGFMNTVGVDDQLTDVLKHTHLRTLLKGEADTCVKAYDQTAENYPLVLKRLESRFCKPGLVLKTLMDQIYSMDKRSWSGKTADMRLFFDTFHSSLCRLEALGHQMDDSFAIHQFLCRITPYSVSRELNNLMRHRGLTEEAVNLKIYRELFEEFLQDRDRLDYQSGTSERKADTEPSESPSGRKGRGGGHHQSPPGAGGSGSTLTTGTKELPRPRHPQKSRFSCYYCGERDHYSDQCTKFQDLRSRREKLKERKRCPTCAWTEHEGPCKMMHCYHCKKEVTHHRSLCPEKFKEVSGSYSTTTVGLSTTTLRTQSAKSADSDWPSEVHLQTARTVLRKSEAAKGRIQCRVLLDQCSDKSYISAEVAKKLKLKSLSSRRLAVYKLRSTEPDVIDTERVKFEMRLTDGTYMTVLAHTISPVTGPIVRYPVSPEVLKVLGEVTLSDSVPSAQEWSQVDLLLGGDVYHQIMSGSKKCLDGHGLFLESSKLGGILCGAVQGDGAAGTPNQCHLTISHSMSAHKPRSTQEHMKESESTRMFPEPEKFPEISLNLGDFWKLESIGIEGSPEVSDDDRALEFFERTVQYDVEKKRYFVKWPQKDTLAELPDNYALALGRLKSQIRQLSSGPKGQELLEKYHAIIMDELQRVMIELVTRGTPQGEVIHYIPHHAVVKENDNATTKVRIVYDGGAKRGKGQKSLNDLLLRGAVMLLDQVGILLRFRLNLVAVISDIEKAFLQVGLQIPDRDVCRFLWLKDPKVGVTEDNLVIYRFTVVPFGVKPSPHLLAVTVAFHLKKNGSPVAMQVLNSIYVDNVITGVSSTEEGLRFCSEAKDIFKEASMNLREWTSNDQSLMSQIPEIERAKGSEVKVLSLNWDLRQDCLWVSGAKKLLETSVKSKRDMLHAVASVYDPLGILSPVMIRLKILLQDLWRTGLGWDDVLPNEVTQRWEELTLDLGLIDSVQVPRFVGSGLSNGELSFQLMCFTDSSKLAFSALTYLKVTDPTDTSSVQLVYAKSRLAPIQEVTIPRLELTGVLIGARMVDFIQGETKLSFSGIFMWTDSTCVMDWMNSHKPLPVFVERRLREIRDLLGKHKFELNYVPTEENPADLATRGCSVEELVQSSLWWNGPAWLVQDQQHWPTFKSTVSVDTVENKEAPQEEPLFEISLVSIGEGPTRVKEPFELKPSDFEKLRHLLRITAWCNRFCDNLRATVQEKTLAVDLNSTEIVHALNLWIKSVQARHFEVQLKYLKASTGKSDNLTHQLGLVLDEERLIRCHGRLDHAELTEGAKWPILLPSKDPFARLVILDSHERLHHSGVTQTLTLVRQKYWILKGRQTVRAVLKGTLGCLVCRRHEGGPYTPPKMPQLPLSRVSTGEVFSVTGLDYLGPIIVRLHKSQADTIKVWICIFTCTRVRAVHLELIVDQSAESFLNGLRRFIAVRGKPERIISDNATQFVLTQKMLKKYWDSAYTTAGQRLATPPQVLSYCSSEGIDWDFITPIAPWMGGFYERLVGSVKRCLRKSLGKRLLSFDQLHTLVKEIEAVLNSRPLTVPGNDLEDHIPLTPNHFLMGHVKAGSPAFETTDLRDPDFQPKCSSAKALFDSWRHGQRVLDQFWQLWKSEYLTGLRESHQPSLRMPRIQARDSPRVGEVVLIFEENQPRGVWQMGQIAELLPGGDDQIRSAMVRLPGGSKLKRSIKHLYPLECNREKEDAGGTQDVQVDREQQEQGDIPGEDQVEDGEDENVRRRPERRAKLEARRKIEQAAQSDEEAEL